MSETLTKLSNQGINVVAAQAVAAGSGRWGAILWVEPEDYARTREALGV